jgi:hypothetical protein
MDQTPLPFELTTTGRTYDHKGSNTVFLKGGPSGWEKRQCTLQVAISADGIGHYKPLLIFGGAEGIGSRTRQAEVKRYHPGVSVIFNPKAYCNSKVMLSWLRQQFKWGSPYSPDDNEPRLLILDSFAPHKNKGPSRRKNGGPKAEEKARAEEFLRQQLREEVQRLNTVTSIIPGGGTPYLQPLDICANKILKDIIRNCEERHYEDHTEEWKNGRFSKPDRRILMTKWVGEAWDILHREYKHTIIKTFRQTGISLNPDGSEDLEIKIRDVPDIEVGDWTRSNEPINLDGMEPFS